MGGTVWATSSGVAGAGSAFHARIRVGVAEGRPVEPPVALPALTGRRLLVVDDNDTNRRLVVRHATAWGMVVTDASSGANALEALQRDGPFEAVVLDLMMPVMDGFDLAAEIRRRVGGRLPLVMLSSVGHEVNKDPRYVALEFAGHLVKPLKPAALRAELSRALGAAADADAGPSRRSGLPPELGRQHPLRILLAEDNAVNKELALKLLERMGYTADVAVNGAEALAAVENGTYDLVLMDVQMPEMDGLEATRQIVERIDAARRPRIVAMTANAMDGDRERCLEAGMQGYISKPIRTNELVEALRTASRLT
jgi:CheY-like chemotaxis protein